MTSSDIENALGNDLKDFLAETGGPIKPTKEMPFAPVSKANGQTPEPTISQQLQAHETYMSRLRRRVHETRIATEEDFGRQAAEIKARYDRQMLTLAEDRADALRALALTFEGKRAELDEVLHRIDTNRA